MSEKPVAKPSGENDQEISNNCTVDKKARDKVFANFTQTENRLFVEELIINLLSCEGISKVVKTMDMIRVCYIAEKQFFNQGRMIEIDGPVAICGDLHGQFPDLIRIFSQVGFPPDTNYLFLGDYVDRGNHNLETILLCVAYKTRYPNNFFMLRGNHELAHMNHEHGFENEVFERIGQHWRHVYDSFTLMMNNMPLTALVGGRILCMHGGLSPKIKNMDSFREIPVFAREKLTRTVKGKDYYEEIDTDILWADPAQVTGWQPNTRGTGLLFGEQEVLDICKMLDIDLVVRGHQCVQDGYEFFASRHLVTVFSAPHYMASFTNSAAVCKVSKDLEISFEVLRPEAPQVQQCVENMSAEPSSGL